LSLTRLNLADERVCTVQSLRKFALGQSSTLARRSQGRSACHPNRNVRKTTSEGDPVSENLRAILHRFAQALSLVIVCHRSLAAQESAHIGDEEETLRRAIRLLQDVYNEVDVVLLKSA
jgi:hypothetical protein